MHSRAQGQRAKRSRASLLLDAGKRTFVPSRRHRSSLPDRERLGRARNGSQGAGLPIADPVMRRCRMRTPTSATLPAKAYGSYLDDEIGAVLMRIKDYAETIAGTAAGMHAYEHQLSEREQQDARKIERLLAEAFAVIDG
jgi:hypothetical protein